MSKTESIILIIAISLVVFAFVITFIVGPEQMDKIKNLDCDELLERLQTDGINYADLTANQWIKLECWK